MTKGEAIRIVAWWAEGYRTAIDDQGRTPTDREYEAIKRLLQEVKNAGRA